MVDVGSKTATERVAIAAGRIRMQPSTLTMIVQGEHKKGDVLGIARIAAIMASKKTSELIPLCHPIGLTHVSVEFNVVEADSAVDCTVTTKTCERTGVEMEALCSLQTGLLTIYDMCKAVDRGMVMENIRLLEKSGGKSGHWKSGD